VLGIVSAVAAPMLAAGFNAHFLGRTLADADWQGRLALERMSRELRSARSATAADLTLSPAAQISFKNTAGQTIAYTLNSSRLQRNSQPLADNVTALNFSYLQRDGKTAAAIVTDVYYIHVDMTLDRGGTAYSLRTTVHPRNFF
jgi:hypothetical protein